MSSHVSRFSTDTSMTTVFDELTANICKLETLSKLLGIINQKGCSDTIAYGFSLMFQDVIKTFKEINRHLENMEIVR